MGAASSGLYPDLRQSSRAVHDTWNDIVLGGTRVAGGMTSFADVLSPEESRAIQAYVIQRALAEPGLDDLLFDPSRGPEPSPAVAAARAELGRLVSEPLEQALAGRKRPARAPWLALCLLRGAAG